MKGLLFTGIFLFIFSGIWAQPVRIASEIQEVMVYQHGAEVKRNGEAKVKPGMNEVIFEGVSSYLLANSISLQGDASVTILSVSYNANGKTIANLSPEAKKLQTQVDTLRRRYEIVRNERIAQEEELTMIRENRRINANKGTFAEELEDAADFYRNRVYQIMNHLIELRAKEAAQQLKLKDAEEQFKEENKLAMRGRGEVIVSIQSSSYATVKLNLSYFTPNAAWRPMYSLRAASISEPVKLEYDAMVKQNSGEDWKNVKLSLSTGNPTFSGRLPDFIRLRADNNLPRNLNNRSGYEGAGNQSYDDSYDADAYEKPGYLGPKGKADAGLDYTSEHTSASSSLLNMVFEINLKYDVQADNKEKFIRIQRNEVKADFRFITYPRLDKNAYLVAFITDWEKLNLIPGEANIFYQGSYVGRSFLNPDITEDSLKISFGPDNEVNVHRQRITESRRRQFLGSNITETFEWAITVKNNKKSQIPMTVIDQVPLSGDNSIEIEMKDKGGATGYEAVNGKIYWETNINSGDTRTFKFSYTVKHPRSQNLYFFDSNDSLIGKYRK